MANIDSPRYPIFTWGKLIFPSNYYMNVTRGASTRRVAFSDTYLVDGVFQIESFLQLPTAMAQALSQVLGAVSNAQTPDGVFSSGVTVTATWSEKSEKNFPVLFLTFSPSVNTEIYVEVGDLDIVYANNIGLDNIGFTVTTSVLPRSTTFDYTPANMWAPNSFNTQETRMYTQDLNVTTSAFTPSVFVVNKWGTERVGLRLFMPAQNAEFIFEYRRTDPNFSQYTEITWPNNLLQQLIQAGRDGEVITIHWNGSESEQFTIQDPERILNFNSNIADVASERRFDVTLMMVKV